MKINENCSKGSGDMEPIQNRRVKPMTLTLGLHTVSLSRIFG